MLFLSAIARLIPFFNTSSTCLVIYSVHSLNATSVVHSALPLISHVFVHSLHGDGTFERT